MNTQSRAILKTIDYMAYIEQKRSKILRQEASSYRGGTLVMREKHGKKYFTEKRGKQEKGITSDKDKIKKLARKEIVKKSYQESKYCYEVLEKAKEGLLQLESRAERGWKFSAIDDYDPRYSLDDWQWMKASFRSNPAYIEDLQYVTGLGTIVRTKSELNIANALELAGVPYRYEMATAVLGKIVYPDFTVKKADGTFVVWEHYGMTFDEDYAAKSEVKSARYEAEGYRRHTDLIITYENDIKAKEDIDKIIRRFILF